MEALILAAGKGQRMDGLSKPFFKPLLEINGIPLLRYAAEYASASGATRATVVASPHNADAVAKCLEQYSSWVTIAVQNEPLGPGHATLIGLSNVVDSRTMLLMSDNLMSIDAVQSMVTECEIKNTSGIGVRFVALEQAPRFTRVRKLGHEVYDFVEGIDVSNDDIWPDTDKVNVWCGPIVFESDRAVYALRKALKARKGLDQELKIGPYLSEIIVSPIIFRDVNAMDVGIPAEFIAKNA